MPAYWASVNFNPVILGLSDFIKLERLQSQLSMAEHHGAVTRDGMTVHNMTCETQPSTVAQQVTC